MHARHSRSHGHGKPGQEGVGFSPGAQTESSASDQRSTGQDPRFLRRSLTSGLGPLRPRTSASQSGLHESVRLPGKEHGMQAPKSLPMDNQKLRNISRPLHARIATINTTLAPTMKSASIKRSLGSSNSSSDSSWSGIWKTNSSGAVPTEPLSIKSITASSVASHGMLSFGLDDVEPKQGMAYPMDTDENRSPNRTLSNGQGLIDDAQGNPALLDSFESVQGQAASAPVGDRTVFTQQSCSSEERAIFRSDSGTLPTFVSTGCQTEGHFDLDMDHELYTLSDSELVSLPDQEFFQDWLNTLYGHPPIPRGSSDAGTRPPRPDLDSMYSGGHQDQTMSEEGFQSASMEESKAEHEESEASSCDPFLSPSRQNTRHFRTIAPQGLIRPVAIKSPFTPPHLLPPTSPPSSERTAWTIPSEMGSESSLSNSFSFETHGSGWTGVLPYVAGIPLAPAPSSSTLASSLSSSSSFSASKRAMGKKNRFEFQ